MWDGRVKTEWPLSSSFVCVCLLYVEVGETGKDGGIHTYTHTPHIHTQGRGDRDGESRFKTKSTHGFFGGSSLPVLREPVVAEAQTHCICVCEKEREREATRKCFYWLCMLALLARMIKSCRERENSNVERCRESLIGVLFWIGFQTATTTRTALNDDA